MDLLVGKKNYRLIDVSSTKELIEFDHLEELECHNLTNLSGFRLSDNIFTITLITFLFVMNV